MILTANISFSCYGTARQQKYSIAQNRLTFLCFFLTSENKTLGQFDPLFFKIWNNFCLKGQYLHNDRCRRCSAGYVDM